MNEEQMRRVALVLAALKKTPAEDRMDVLALACAAFLQGALISPYASAQNQGERCSR